VRDLLGTYLEREMEVGKVGVRSCLKHVSLEVNVCDLINLQYLLFVDLFERVNASMQVDKRDDPVAASAQIMDKFDVFHS